MYYLLDRLYGFIGFMDDLGSWSPIKGLKRLIEALRGLKEAIRGLGSNSIFLKNSSIFFTLPTPIYPYSYPYARFFGIASADCALCFPYQPASCIDCCSSVLCCSCSGVTVGCLESFPPIGFKSSPTVNLE